MKPTPFAFLILLFLLVACSGEDRSGEEPFPPTVRTLSAEAVADSCIMHGEIVSSPNSSITGRGFYYGNDTLRVEVISRDTVGSTFTAVADSIRPGHYYVCAFATNGMGTTRGDTLYFNIYP